MSTPNQFALLKERRFLPFFLTQALGAFNDNVFKNALIILITFLTVGLNDAQVLQYTNLAAGLFILPFFLFSATSGQLADKYDKARLAQWSSCWKSRSWSSRRSASRSRTFRCCWRCCS